MQRSLTILALVLSGCALPEYSADKQRSNAYNGDGSGAYQWLFCAPPQRAQTASVRLTTHLEFATYPQDPQPFVVRACNSNDPGCQSPVGPLSINAGEQVVFDLPTGFVGQLEFVSPSALPALYSLPDPLLEDVALAAPSIPSSDTLDELSAAANVKVDPQLGFVLTTVVDCSGEPLTGASVSGSSSASAIYFSNSLPDQTHRTTGVDGMAAFLNVVPGQVTVGGTYMSTNYPSAAVEAKAGWASFVQVHPRYIDPFDE